MQLSIIIVSFNTQELLMDCLKSIYLNYRPQLKQQEYEIIVVDNASTDNTCSAIKNSYPEIKIIENSDNVGFARANNQGIKLARGDNILLLNPDTVVPAKTLTYLVRFMQNNEKVGIASCKVLLPDGMLDDASHRGFPTPLRALFHFTGIAGIFPKSRFFNGYHLGYSHINEVHKIDACVGAFLMIKRKVGEIVGWLDEDYFWYGEDLDLCYRVKQQGFKIMFVPQVAITHHKGAASGIKEHSKHLSKADRAVRLRATQARFEVMRLFYKKHYLNLYPKWLTWLVFLAINIKQKIAEITL